METAGGSIKRTTAVLADHAVLTIMRMRALRRKMPDHTYGFQWTSAGSLQRSVRENPTNVLTSVAR